MKISDWNRIAKISDAFNTTTHLCSTDCVRREVHARGDRNHFFHSASCYKKVTPAPELEMVRSKIFQARTTHSLQHPAHNRPWIEDIYYFSNRPAHGPPNNWQSPLIFPPEAKYLSWLYCLPRQNIWWDYFAFCGTWLAKVVVWCDNHNIQSYMLWLVWA